MISLSLIWLSLGCVHSYSIKTNKLFVPVNFHRNGGGIQAGILEVSQNDGE